MWRNPATIRELRSVGGLVEAEPALSDSRMRTGRRHCRAARRLPDDGNRSGCPTAVVAFGAVSMVAVFGIMSAVKTITYRQFERKKLLRYRLLRGRHLVVVPVE
jgi:hypothetical protein